ncbi:MAG: transcription termination/antitermination protein NusA [Alphaproteobacteria bacterium]|nr:transcription termination/antitermination protein NusA [Alphaproteobacteria bacterium]
MQKKSFGNTEILQIADAVAREKGVDRDAVIQAMEFGIRVAGRRKYGYEHNIRAEIDRKTGEIRLFRELSVVSDDASISDKVSEKPTQQDDDGDGAVEENTFNTIRLTDALVSYPDVKVGDVISEPLPPIDLGRVAAQSAKQVIISKVRHAERDVQFQDFKDRVGEIANGVVRRIDFGNIVVAIGSAEAVLRRDKMVKGESYRINDRLRAYIEDVRREVKGPQIFLSRTANKFMAKLFEQEVPEVYDKVIEIKSVAREPGSRAKIAVYSNDPSIDPIGSCVGVRGARVQAVINELQGEKIDIVLWAADPATFVVNALAPAQVSKVIIDESRHRLEVVVPNDQLSLAIGRRGQNVRLAAELVGWRIDVMTEEDESKRRAEEFQTTSSRFIEGLHVEDVIAQLLAVEGFSNIEEIAYVDPQELEAIEGFDADIAAELQHRARTYLNEKEANTQGQLSELGIQAELLDLPHVTTELIIELAKKGVKTLDDLANLSHDEFEELAPQSGLNHKQVDEVIMKARSHWFEEEGNKE